MKEFTPKGVGLTEMKSGKGFTLVETMVAVSILTLAVAGPLVTASRSIVAAQSARDHLVASYLAQEGIEYMRYVRDSAFLGAYNTNSATASSVGWNNFLTGTTEFAITACRAPRICTLDPLGTVPLAVSCPDDGNGNFVCTAPLYLLANGLYSQQVGAKRTPFIRTIQAIDTSPNDVSIVSKVSWSFHGIQRSVTVTSHLTPWQ